MGKIEPTEGNKNVSRTLTIHLLSLQGISPIGKMQAPQKPWEKKQQQQAQAAAANPVTTEVLIDSEFPPLEDEGQQDQEQPQKIDN